ncbi:MAG: Na+/H+ antiporter NhaA type [uncultured Chloroflexia bacterium]|uniref:Na(+)/H(+) antiporter NhaA n=1 Tax=uncultured Chloroflexia bacterium TaxID=1672391 RepID=A0A6J4KM12_9CHLR|nr:MAG: Na+/H+ antiporter NhaA type [uncultured Chloroflexia bacterium]
MADTQHNDLSRRNRVALQVIGPFQAFARSGSLGGLFLLLAALLAFAWANSPWAATYNGILSEYLSLNLGDWSLRLSLAHWVNDGLMAIFFLMVGLELKRELITGELSRPRQAALGVAAALGGMVIPALVYVLINRGGAGLEGWAIPMATDIAFALAAISVLGSRVPLGLKVFLTALAIVDDLGAVLVIGLFYTSGLNLGALGVAFALLASLFVFNRMGIRHLGVYLIPGIFLWYFVLLSGLHATLAGVLIAFIIPIARRVTAPVDELREAVKAGDAEAVGSHLAAVERVLEAKQSPLHRLEHALHPYVNFLVLPIFALFNAGLSLAGVGVGSVTLGIAAGLVVGKPLGVFLLSFIAVKTGLAQLPAGVTWRGVLGVGLLAGIGFTMSLFIAGLSFEAELYNQARLGIIVGSLVSAGLGIALLATGKRTVAP